MHARASGAGAAALRRRRAEVCRDLVRYGHYDHTTEELAFGAKLAWRNHARCIGRLFWDSLVVRDRRHVAEPRGDRMAVADLGNAGAEALLEELRGRPGRNHIRERRAVEALHPGIGRTIGDQQCAAVADVAGDVGDIRARQDTPATVTIEH
ncbi:MAG: nitric oxide synthase oxygenase, partial [Roseicyclus sp.]